VYTSETYPDGVIPTGLEEDTLKDEFPETVLDPPIFTNGIRMYFLPHEDGKLKIGADCSICSIVEFMIEDPSDSLIISYPSLGSVSKPE
jgi:hypothetical protein